MEHCVVRKVSFFFCFLFFSPLQSCLCFSAIIFFFVKSDVQKRTSPESMPLLIDDRVSYRAFPH